MKFPFGDVFLVAYVKQVTLNTSYMRFIYTLYIYIYVYVYIGFACDSYGF